MKVNKISFSTQVALVSFAIGTFLFIAFQITKEDSLLFIGLYYVLMAIFFNMLILIALFYEFLFKSNKEETAIKMLILLSNIPIAYLYFTLIINNQ